MATETFCDVCGEAPGTEERCTGGDTSMFFCEPCAVKCDREAEGARAAAKADLAAGRMPEAALVKCAVTGNYATGCNCTACMEARGGMVCPCCLLPAEGAECARHGRLQVDAAPGDPVAELAAMRARSIGRRLSLQETMSESMNRRGMALLKEAAEQPDEADAAALGMGERGGIVGREQSMPADCLEAAMDECLQQIKRSADQSARLLVFPYPMKSARFFPEPFFQPEAAEEPPRALLEAVGKEMSAEADAAALGGWYVDEEGKLSDAMAEGLAAVITQEGGGEQGGLQ